ncbi:MAG: glycosyltransferase family 4 protein [Acidobacteriota bacterium]|nr:glycosyltransferase family 4 protein [Acidobacteriota bacterium]
MKVAFLLNDLQLSGGVGVVARHAMALSEMPGFEVSLVLAREQETASWHGHEQLPHLAVLSREEALAEAFDMAVATWWETAFTLFELNARRHAYFVQSLEDRFYLHDQSGRLGARLTLDLPVAFITEARWIASTLAGLRPDAPCFLVRNGIDKELYGPRESVEVRGDGPLRVLIEGSAGAWFKHVRDAVDAAAAMRATRHVTVVTPDRESLGRVPADRVLGPVTQAEMVSLYDESDVVLKLSSVEGMFGPPLEGFHRGATCVVTPVSGHEEYVQHGWNGLLTDWDDLRGTARALDLLAIDRDLLRFLQVNALETARSWPSWEQSSRFMAAALGAIMGQPAAGGAPAAARLLADLRGGLELYDGHLRERADFAHRALRFERLIARLSGGRTARTLLALRRNRVMRLVVRPLRPLFRRARAALR